MACVGLAGSVIKGLSAAASVQGQGVAAPLMQRMFYEAVDRGRGTLFAFTKPCNRLTLESLGFTFLAEVPGAAILLENSPFALELYLDELRAMREPGDRVGAVVLHANPFTLGHLHLLRTAAEQVDVLHVFVVAEHAPGAFPADVRLRLVREGVADAGIDNIRAIAARGTSSAAPRSPTTSSPRRTRGRSRPPGSTCSSSGSTSGRRWA